jgi:hypothetical protein
VEAVKTPTDWCESLGKVISRDLDQEKGKICAMANDLTSATITLTELFRPYVGMLFFAPADNLSPTTVRFNGTASFVDTGSAKVVVTCAHVLRRFRELRLEEPELDMFITGSSTNHVLRLEETYLVSDGGKSVDLAVFKFPNPDQVLDLGKCYFQAAPWPPLRPEVGRTAIIAGFQGEHREARENALRINLTVFCDLITSVSDRHLVLADESATRVCVKLNQDLGDLGLLGGLSGSAVFTTDSDNSARLAGFLYETGSGTDATVFAIHADFLNDDGTINRRRIAW